MHKASNYQGLTYAFSKKRNGLFFLEISLLLSGLIYVLGFASDGCTSVVHSIMRNFSDYFA